MMSSKNLKDRAIKKILVISLSNVGDVILTFPVIDILKKEFPLSELSLVVGPKALPLVEKNPAFYCVHVFDKHQSLGKTLKWLAVLRKEKFDLVVDLRHTAIPLFVATRYLTPLFVKTQTGIHMKTKHLNRLKSVFYFVDESREQSAFYVPQEDERYISDIIKTQVGAREKFVVVAPGAADQKKRWPADSFAKLCDELARNFHLKIVFVGDDKDCFAAQDIMKQMKQPSVNLCGRTTLVHLGALLKKAFFVIANDSAVMHLASYIDKPTIGLFGPSDPKKYGPWSRESLAIKKDVSCAACQGVKGEEHACLSSIEPQDVLKVIQISADSVKFLKP